MGRFYDILIHAANPQLDSRESDADFDVQKYGDWCPSNPDRAPNSYAYKWRAAILVDGYPVWSRGFETKEAKTVRDALRERPTPDLSCPECSNDDVIVGQKSADGGKVQRWFDCPDCGYEGCSQNVYGAER